jgi:hypothetical protein
MQISARVLLGLLYLIAVLLPFREFMPRFATHLIGDHGDALLQHLHCSWQWLALAEGRFSEIYSLPTMAPYPSGLSFGEPLVGIVFPLAPVHWLTGSSMAAFNAGIVASFVLLGVGTFLWVREVTGSTPAGLFAGMLVLFPPWRVHYLSAANVLTLHYAVFAMWLLSRWLRQAGLGLLLGAALLFQLQLVTAAQGGVPAIYLTIVWLAVAWAGHGFALDARRCVQLAAGATLFVGLSLPWLAFFQPAFEATSGQPSWRQMARYTQTFAEMAHATAMAGPLGICAALGLGALPLGLRRAWLPRGAGWTLLGVLIGGAMLFVLARGPSLDPELGSSRLPGYYASQFLPLLEMFRAPVRLAGLTPLVLSLFAGVGLAVVQRALAPQRALGLFHALPLLVVLTWPSLPGEMANPIATRGEEQALTQALAKLPADANILSLPMELGLPGAAVDERVLVHRRRQIGGFASVVPRAFLQAALALGQWPASGLEIGGALGTTHVVVPRDWLERHRESALASGHASVVETSDHAVLSFPRLENPPDALRLEAPGSAASGRWLTLALFSAAHRFEPRGHQRVAATWRQGDEVSHVEATFFYPGVVGPHAPTLVHVPTPSAPGAYGLHLPGADLHGTLQVEVESQPTSFDFPIADADVELAPDYRVPAFIRASGAFEIDVKLRARSGPILLASSRHLLPERQGETQVLIQYRSRAGERLTQRLPERRSLTHDLAPGDEASLRWTVRTPRQPGTYDLYVRLIATGLSERPMPWRPLLRGVEVALD